DVYVRVVGEIVRHIVKGAGQQQIVRVEIGHDLARRMLKAEVDRMRLAVILAGLAMTQHGPIALEDLRGVVGRATVLDDVVKRTILLAQHAVDGSSEEDALVERWRDYGNRDRSEARFGRVMTGRSEWSGPVLLHHPKANTDALPHPLPPAPLPVGAQR